MVLLSIGFTPGKSDVYKKINELSAYYRLKGINIALVESDSGDMHFIKCVISDEDCTYSNISDIRKSFNAYAAGTIYQVIMDNYQIDIINKIIRDNYSYLKTEEISQVAARCIQILDDEMHIDSSEYSFYGDRKSRITGKIHEYISENTDIILEGFLRFRLKELNNEFEEVVDRVVEEFLVEREYNEFIKLLKYFVEIQESCIDIVNIVARLDGSYCMYDGSGNEITSELLKDLTNEPLGGEATFDDLLVSSLITAAPRYIIIHNMPNIKNKEIIETIKSVFAERVRICPGCDLCIKKSPAHKL
jgi:putative sporulation protein YtxC